jgi:hypothetical protein
VSKTAAREQSRAALCSHWSQSMDSKMLFVLFLAGAALLAFVAAYVGILQ